MTCYNHGHFVGEALEAILGQSYRPLEVIVVDDASTDTSLAVIQKIAESDPAVRLVRNDRNQGAVFSARRALGLARGDYVYGASADDKILPGFFEKSIRCLLSHPQAMLCCSDPAYFNDAGLLKSRAFRLSRQPTYLSPEAMVAVIRKENFIVGGHTTIARLDAFKEAGGLIESLKWHCDWFAYHVMAFRYGSCYVPEFLASMRASECSYSKRGVRTLNAQRQVIAHILDLLMQDRFKDVRRQFASSGILSAFGIPALKYVFRNARFRRFCTGRLLWNTFKRALKGTIGNVAPTIVKKAYRLWRDSPRPFILTRKCYGG